MMPEPVGVYVHIPFCRRKCHYCDFACGVTPEGQRRRYLEVLEREIAQAGPKEAWTLFLGGGTPSLLRLPELESLLRALETSFSFRPGSEWTIECNPGTVGLEQLEGYRALGFERISLGVQSFRDEALRALGRVHTGEEARRAYTLARRAGFENINLDLIFGQPGQTLEEWIGDLEEALALAPEHLSLYQLTIEKGTLFGRRRELGLLSEVEEELGARMYEEAMDRTAARGYRQYEISNFARPGRRCRHNLLYWKLEPYLGFGLAAASYLEGRRWSNTRNLEEYIRTGRRGRPARACQERLSSRRALGEEIMLRLRISEGVPLGELSRRYGLDLTQLFADSLEFLVSQRVVEQRQDRLLLTRRGRLLANEVCQAFL